MKNDKEIMEFYYGCEVGPIRPPSEAHSLLIRVTRNCHWNRCTFCPVYKQLEFSRRPIEHVKTDIDFIRKYTEK
ncbi:MAG: radical SAM protein, partial [Candidatus Thorarchaeota archaeon]|nr:radical SAM protein [Candidatus Thorarchaeota archaeon]